MLHFFVTRATFAALLRTEGKQFTIPWYQKFADSRSTDCHIIAQEIQELFFQRISVGLGLPSVQFASCCCAICKAFCNQAYFLRMRSWYSLIGNGLDKICTCVLNSLSLALADHRYRCCETGICIQTLSMIRTCTAFYQPCLPQISGPWHLNTCVDLITCTHEVAPTMARHPRARSARTLLEFRK